MNTPININMKNFFPAFFVFIFISCSGLPTEKADIPHERIDIPHEISSVPHEKTEITHERTSLPPEWRPETVSAVPERPVPSVYIMGKGVVSSENLTDYLLFSNSGADRDFVLALSNYYIEEAALEGVNHDIAFAQMCLETGFLRFGNLVKPEWNNFCGLGAIGPEQPGLIFPDARTGVRAHIQHLKGYASSEPLSREQVNPRYTLLQQLGRIGSSPTIQGLSGTWAADREYAVKIENILNRLYEFSFNVPGN